MRFEEVENFYIVKDGVTYQPLTTCEIKIDENGNFYGEHTIIKTAEEVYEGLLNIKNNPPTPQLTPEETLAKELAAMKIDNMKKDLTMNNTLKAMVELKLQIMNLKGGTV